MKWSDPLLGTIPNFIPYKAALLLESFNPALERCPLATGDSLEKKGEKKKSGVFNWVNKLSIPYYLHERRLNWVERPLK